VSDDLRARLDQLRQKLARIDARYERQPPAPARGLPEGHEVETALGRHWELDKLWPAAHRHGSADVGALSELPADLLVALDETAAIQAAPERWAFLDTETSGLSGGSGAFAFLVGVGCISPRGFEMRQFFMRDHGEEPSMLSALAEYMARFDVLITYNGRAFDAPLLETRYRLARQRPPLARLAHIDLLYSARRLWRLALDSCRLQELEQRILGVERVGDIPGARIPMLYFEALRTGDLGSLWPVITHNAIDILSLACLTAIVPAAFREPERLTAGAEMVGLARWLRGLGRLEEALGWMTRALTRPMDDRLTYETLWHAAEIERKLGRHDEAAARCRELAGIDNPWRAQAYERLAIHYEHRERNPALALEMALAAAALEPGEAISRRIERLRRKDSSARLL
jgi:uncharacterized protein YprB with RNaseH-like and TPR domain